MKNLFVNYCKQLLNWTVHMCRFVFPLQSEREALVIDSKNNYLFPAIFLKNLTKPEAVLENALGGGLTLKCLCRVLNILTATGYVWAIVSHSKCYLGGTASSSPTNFHAPTHTQTHIYMPLHTTFHITITSCCFLLFGKFQIRLKTFPAVAFHLHLPNRYKVLIQTRLNK